MIFGILMVVIMVALDAMFYYVDIMLGAGGYYFLLLSGWFDLIITVGFWGIYEFFLTPTSAKRLRTCKMEKKMPVICEHDSGLLEVKIEKESTPEGGIITKDGFIAFVPRATMADNQKEAEMLNELMPMMSKRSFLPDVGMPVWFGYTGKGVLTNLRTVAELQHGDEAMKDQSLPQQNTEIQKKATDGSLKTRVVNIFWPVSLKNLKEYFPKSWNQATIRAMEKRAQLIGAEKEKARHRMEKGYIYFLLALAALFGMAIIFVVVSRMG